MGTAGTLARAREDYDRHAWRAAYDGLLVADGEQPLELQDLERLAIAAYLIGSTDDLAFMIRAHHEAVRQRTVNRASRMAFWIGFASLDRGEHAQASGWLTRAGRLLEGQAESVEHGYVLLPTALEHLEEGRFAEARATFVEIARIAERFADPDLITFARLGQGQALVRLGDMSPGMAALDEAMVAVTADEVSPMVVGIIYCSVIETCQRLFDLRRAQEWTDALTSWCVSQPDLVPYRGQCLINRAELLRLHGSWSDATDEARRAHAWLTRPPVDPAAGVALYQLAELHRLRGEFVLAEASYEQATGFGYRPEPGLALLRLAQGDPGRAVSTIRRGLDETPDPLLRPRVLDAAVEIMLAAGDRSAAEAAAAELRSIAGDLKAPLLAAMADRATGAVLLATGDARAAMTALRRAFRSWRSVDAPYEVARTRALIGLAYVALADGQMATIEFEAAHQTFLQLGARPDLARLSTLSASGTGHAGGLTSRELEVLRLLATGMTNRAVATELVISEKTVARHVANIFTKLDVTSRSAATAYAYEHGLAGTHT